MINIPSPVLDYICDITVENRSPAYLLVTKDGYLSNWGGNLVAYGLINLEKEKYVKEQVVFLEGLLPLDDSPIFLPGIKTEDGLSADVHLFSRNEGDWVLLLDATIEENQHRPIQQEWNNLSLFWKKEFRILNQYVEKNAPTNVTQSVLTVEMNEKCRDTTILAESGIIFTVMEAVMAYFDILPSTKFLAQAIKTVLNIFLLSEIMTEAITANLLATLDIVVIEYLDESSFEIIGTVPDWFRRFYPDAVLEQNKLIPAKNFPFLENFLIDAECFWMGNDAGRLKSGVWSEIDTLGNEYHLEASAVCLTKKKILLIELIESAYKEKQTLIQKGRENSLSYYHLVKETQKKEILLHCIMHDLAGEITPINYCFQLLEVENLSFKGREYLEIGRKQCTKQEVLIREILNAFSAEVESLEAFTRDRDRSPDALICVKVVLTAFVLTFSVNHINLQLAPDIKLSEDWKVTGEKLRLERVISNLVENALRHSPINSTVTVGLEQDQEFILITVDDEGSGVAPDMSKNLFQKFSQGKEKSGKAGLGLYFCRITVERWGGTIGYEPRKEGGSRFWFRLPKPV